MKGYGYIFNFSRSLLRKSHMFWDSLQIMKWYDRQCGHRGREWNSTIHFAPSIKEPQVNVFCVFDFSKDFVWRKMSEASFVFCCVIFFVSTGLDSIIFGNLIKILKCRDVIFSSLFTFYITGVVNFLRNKLRRVREKSFLISLCYILLLKCLQLCIKEKKSCCSLPEFFLLLKLENDIQSYKNKLKALDNVFLLKTSNRVLSVFIPWTLYHSAPLCQLQMS